MPQTREIIFEFHRVGGYVQVSAVDTLTSAEVSIVGPPSAGQVELERLAARKLEYVLTKRAAAQRGGFLVRSEEHTSELQSLMRSTYAVFCLKKDTHQHD